MKKHLLAVAVASAVAAPVMAQNVTLSGRIDAAIQSVGTGSVTTSNVGSATWTTPRLTLNVSEDLGGGLKAAFVHETGISSDTGAMTMGDRESSVRLAGAFGEVQIGRTTNLASDTDSAVNAFGGNQGLVGKRWMVAAEVAVTADSVGTAANTGIDGLGDKMTNSIQYISPVVSGFQFAAQAGFGEDTTVGEKGNLNSTAMALSYTSGPLKAVVSSGKQSRKGVATTYGDIKQTAFGVGYDAGFAKAGFVSVSADRDTKASNDKDNVSIFTLSVPLGSGNSVFGAIHNADIAGLANSGATATVIGFSKEMSKRTRFYASYAATKNEAAASYNISGQAAATSTAGLDPKTTSFGVVHTF